MDIINGLRQGENKAFEKVYRKYYRVAQKHIVTNNGKDEDAEDVFQEALVYLVKNIRKPDFKLTSALGTYLIGIVKNLWLEELRKRKKRTNINQDSQLIQDRADTEGEDQKKEVEILSKLNLVNKILKSLKRDHVEILLDFYHKKLSLKEMAEKRGISPDAMKVKKSRILKAVRDHAKKAS